MNAENDREFQTVVLAALLHDIGKFAQRTGQHPGRRHPELSTWFASEHLGSAWKREVADAVDCHHLSDLNSARDQRLAMTLVLADWLSCGERRELPAGETGAPANDPLISIFSQLSGSSSKTKLPLIALPGDGKLEPCSDIATGQDRYRELWDKFEAECRLAEHDDFPALVDHLLTLLEKFTIFVPSAAWRTETDISLFHHLKSTAAIASCLHRAGFDATGLDDLLKSFETSDRCIAYLVGGDISGIQSFIYNLRARGALKGLRGRSLYLQLVSEVVAASIIDRFNLTRANIIYCGGGHFYLLIPGTPDAETQLLAAGRHVEEVLFKAHHGRLSLALATRKLVPRDFRRKDFGAAWDDLHVRLAREKKRRFAKLLQSSKDGTGILGPAGVGGERPACPVCGEEVPERRRDSEEPCPLCSSFAELGKSLRAAGFMVELSVERMIPEHPECSEVLAALGREYRFVVEPQSNGSAFVLNETSLPAGVHGFRFIAKHVPMKGDATAELKDIADKAKGIKRWGVLRMDVDNLGRTFKEGLGIDRSISRLATLSYLLHYFFSARVQAIAREGDYKDKVYLAYSGGDDLFVVGAWSALPTFAERLHNEFHTFTSQRLNLSAGILVAPTITFPIFEAAQLAGEAEATSKSKGRDRLTFLGRTLQWSELPRVREIKDELVGLLSDGLPRSILGILASIWQQRQAASKGEIPLFPVWRLFYALRRMQQRHKELAGRIEALRGRVVQDNDLHPFLDLITRWAEYETREPQEKL